MVSGKVLCLWKQVTRYSDKRISSVLRHTSDLHVYGASTSLHVIDAWGVGEYTNVFHFNNCFVVFLSGCSVKLIWNLVICVSTCKVSFLNMHVIQ